MKRILCSLCLALALAGCQEQQSMQRPMPTVSVIQPAVREVIDYDEYTGRLEAVQSVDIRARVSGFLEQVAFEDGQIVQKGDLLFQIDPRPFEAEVKVAKGALQLAQAQAELAQKEFQRSQKLINTGAISQEEEDRRKQDLAARQGAVITAEGNLQQAELNLEFCRVTAPITGRISERFVDKGNYIEGGSGNATLLTRIVTDNPIYVYWDTDESSVLKYTRATLSGKLPTVREKKIPVQLELSDEEGFPHTGAMDFAENRLDNATASIRVRAIFDNPEGLMTPGMFARVKVRASEPYNAMMVPDSAIGTDQNQRYVFVLGEDNTVAYRKVELGPRFGADRAIRGGLEPGEWVVVDNLQLLRPGAQVNADRKTPDGTQTAQAKQPAAAPEKDAH